LYCFKGKSDLSPTERPKTPHAGRQQHQRHQEQRQQNTASSSHRPPGSAVQQPHGPNRAPVQPKNENVPIGNSHFYAGPNTDPNERPTSQHGANKQQPQRFHPSSRDIEEFQARESELNIKLESALEEIRRKEKRIKELDSEAEHLRLR